MNPFPSRLQRVPGWFAGTRSGALWVALAGVTLTWIATVAIRRVDRDFAAEVFRERASRCCLRVSTRLETLEARLALAERLVLPKDLVTDEDWATWFRANIRSEYPEVVDFSYFSVNRMPSYSFDSDSPESGDRGLLSARLWTSARWNPGSDAAESDEAKKSLRDWMLGLGKAGDVESNVHRALVTGRTRMSGLLAEEPGAAGEENQGRVRLLIPVSSAASRTYASTNLVGILCATLDIPTVLHHAIQGGLNPLYRACSVQDDKGNWIPVGQASDPTARGAAAGRSDAVFRDSRDFFGRLFQCEFWGDPVANPVANHARAWGAAALGLVSTGLLSGLVWAQGRSRRDQARIAAELREANERLAAVTRERERLTRDLHDGTIQSIYALGFDLQRVRNVVERDPGEARAELTRALAALNEVVSELRDFIVQEDSTGPRTQNVESVLQALVQRVRRNTQAEVSLDLSPEAARLVAPRQAVEVLQIVREAITNSLRHAYPRQIGVALTREGSDWRLTIADDGTGFDPRRVNGRVSHGLRNLHERADELGGECEIVSAPSTGTAIRVIFPVLTPPHPSEVGTETA
ncbi:MAG: sensor histidine kinase [Verrucomicrobiales bacterium]|nr:sensor histidine kinase [Verrucomicrobiales bacterium]